MEESVSEPDLNLLPMDRWANLLTGLWRRKMQCYSGHQTESRAAMLRKTEILDGFQGNFLKNIVREGSWQGMWSIHAQFYDWFMER